MINNLSISSKYETFDENFWNNHIPAFNPNKNKLTAININQELPQEWITNIEQIACYVNNLSKPIYQEIDRFYNMCKNIEKINQLIQESNSNNLINFKPFCLNLRPSYEELSQRIYAVHVTDYLWPDAVMRPFLKALDLNKKGEGLSFSVHFSLSEMVRSHSLNTTWKYRKIALITPLSELEEKLAGIHPYDSFIHGEWKITPRSILIAPQGMNIPEIYSQEGIKVVTYDPETHSLRRTIKNQILEQGGVYLKMVRNLLLPGSPAYLYGNKKLNVNYMGFFENLLQRNQKLSFGNDTRSLNNRFGFCFGGIRQFSSDILDMAARNPNNAFIKFLYRYFQFMYNQIKKDLTPIEEEQAMRFMEKFDYCLKFNFDSFTPYAITDILSNLNYEEFKKFKDQNPEQFTKLTDYIIDADWAVKRWLILGRELGEKENLEEIYKENMNAFFNQENPVLVGTILMDIIVQNLEGQSEQGDLTLYILNLEETRKYNKLLIEKFIKDTGDNWQKKLVKGSFFLPTDYSTDSIESMLSRYTKTRQIFEREEILPSIELVGSYYLGDQN